MIDPNTPVIIGVGQCLDRSSPGQCAIVQLHGSLVTRVTGRGPPSLYDCNALERVKGIEPSS